MQTVPQSDGGEGVCDGQELEAMIEENLLLTSLGVIRKAAEEVRAL